MKKVILIFIVVFFCSGQSAPATIDTNRIWGVTIDAISNLNAIVTSLSRLCKKPTTRIVFDEFIPASEYQNAVNQISNVSFIMGELLDSYYVNQYTLSQYAARTNEYVSLLGNKVDIWEIGNEVNGEWLGSISDVISKIDTAFKIVKSKGKKTALTLYYNKACYELPKNEMFRWVNENLNLSIRKGLDYVWISYYEDDCEAYQPDWQLVFDSLHVLFPNSKIGIGECGTLKTLRKASYINQYYKMNISTPKYVGGYFWWYYKQDCVPYTDTLWTVLNNAMSNSVPPTIQASQLSYFVLSQNSISINWLSGNGNKEAVFICEGTSGVPTIQDGITYNANATFGMGFQDGTGWYCVYNGVSNPQREIVIDGLLSFHSYRVMVVDYNGNPGFEGYNKTVSLNNPLNIQISMPVELISFSSRTDKNNILLYWITGKEINNSGFEVERIQNGLSWEKIGFVKGNGTNNGLISYKFSDNNLSKGKYKYRLKQIDYNGNFEYHYLNKEIEIDIPGKYELNQNYPNPFNSSTKITYSLPEDGLVNIQLYDALGRKIKTLVNEYKSADLYSFNFNVPDLSAGVYFYEIKAGSYINVRKMMYIK